MSSLLQGDVQKLGFAALIIFIKHMLSGLNCLSRNLFLILGLVALRVPSICWFIETLLPPINAIETNSGFFYTIAKGELSGIIELLKQ